MTNPLAPMGAWFVDLRLEAKLLAATLGLSVVPLLLLGILSFQTSSTVLQSVSEQQDRKILEGKKRFVLTVMGEVESLIANVSGQDALKSILARPLGDMSDYDKLSTQARIGYILSGYINLKGLVSIDVFARGGTTFHVGDTLEMIQTREPLVRRLTDQAAGAETAVYWSGVEVNINTSSAYDKVINAVKRLPSRTGDPADDALMVVSFDPHVLNQGNETKEGGYSILLDGRNRVVIHPDEALWGEQAPGEILRPLADGKTVFRFRDGGGSYLDSTIPLEKTPWTLLQVTSLAGIEGATGAIALGTLSSLALALVLMGFLTRLISRRVVTPIRQITLGFQTLQAAGSPEPKRLDFESRDEIGTLTRWYNAFLNTYQEKKVAEDALLELNRTLSSRVETEVTANREKDSMLIQQSRQASMGEMIGNIAHQWRQPLNTVALLVQELEVKALDGPLDGASVAEFSAQTLAVLDRMSTTIDDFRDFFRPNKAKVPFAVEPLVTTALSFVEPAFKNHSIEVILENLHPGTLVGYPNELSQVLLNILNNARDALIEGNQARKAVRIRLQTLGNRTTITIADSGGGIPPDILPKIFDPYFSTKGPSKGTGLGLFMCQVIVERNMGGRISARNIEFEPGVMGAEFLLELTH